MPNPCVSCGVANGDIIPLGGDVARTSYFNVSQDVEYKIPGFMMVASNRHFRGFDEMSDEEARDFALLVKRVREAQRSQLGIEDVYYFYNEDTRHHFHLWMIPRIDGLKQFGRSLESVAPGLAWSRDQAPDENAILDSAEKIRKRLTDS